MPLPTEDTPWPPPALTPVYADMAEADVWYTGDKRALADYYGKAVQRDRDRPSVEARLWAQHRALDQPERRVHVPIAGDIATASADLLFSSAPTIRFEDTTTQDRFDQLAEDGGMHMRLLEAAELGAALGDSYLAVVWDRDAVPDRPILTSWSGDMAVPTIRYGRLIEVTFWRELAREGDTVVRLLERHAVEAGAGLIEYGLYEGTSANLGRQIPYSNHPDAEHLDALVDENGRQFTRIPYLTATHIPNARPNRRHRGYHGRSDYAAPVYDEFDAIDQTMTSWMRDIRLGKGRLVVPQGALTDLGPGQGSYFDMDREVYEELSLDPSATGASSITVAQFAIRVEEHRATIDHLLATTARACGYSPSTFGLAEQGERTATEVVDRKSRSISSTDRKGMYWKPALRRITQAWIALDRAHFSDSDSVEVDPPTVELAPPERPSEESEARTIQMLRGAEAISTWLVVKRQHPEWGDREVQEEVDRIHADRTTDADPWTDGARVAGNLLGDQGDGPPEGDPDQE